MFPVDGNSRFRQSGSVTHEIKSFFYMFLFTHISKAECINEKGLKDGTVGRKSNGRIMSRISYVYHLTLLKDN